MDLWYTESHTPNVGFRLRVKRTLFTGSSEFQEIAVVETEDFGKVLLLDGLVMTTERDEFIYHEMIAHPALFLHPDARDVLVIGGGDGGAVREVVKHPGVTRVVLCEIDGTVVETCRRFFPKISSALEGDPRVEVVIQDGITFLDKHLDAFDVILVDSTDPIGPATGLFKTDFYRKCFSALRSDGILAAQSESPFYHLPIIEDMHRNLKETGFPVVKFCHGYVPSYPSGMWSWVVASKRYDPVRDFQPERVSTLNVPTDYYTSDLHRAAFALPAFFARALEGE